MKTRALIPIFVIALVALSGCSLVGRGPSGETATEVHTVRPFTEVALQGVGDVTVVPGDDYTVTVTTDTTFMDGVRVEVVDGVLELNEDYDFETRDLQVDFLVTAPSLESATLAGAGNLTIALDNAEAFSVTLAGAGNIAVSGSASTIGVFLAGAGNINTAELDASTIDVRLAGAGNVDLGAPDLLTVKLTGVGHVTYAGTPQVDSTVTGVGSVVSR